MALLLTILAVLVILIGSELWWRRRVTHGEFSRKFVHITVGSFVAFWPLFLTWGEIRALSVAFVVCVGISKYLHVFQAIHSVQRPTWGELCFAAAVGLVTLITNDPAIYTAALLQMSLADGLAAVVGSRFGKRHSYLIFGHSKSVIGTLTFCIVSVAVLLAINSRLDAPLTFAWVVGISALAGLIENFGIRGFDNLLVPVLVALLLTNS